MRPHLGAGRWLDYLGDDRAEDAIRAAYAPTTTGSAHAGRELEEYVAATVRNYFHPPGRAPSGRLPTSADASTGRKGS